MAASPASPLTQPLLSTPSTSAVAETSSPSSRSTRRSKSPSLRSSSASSKTRKGHRRKDKDRDKDKEKKRKRKDKDKDGGSGSNTTPLELPAFSPIDPDTIFSIGQRLGEGSFGLVCECKEVATGKPYAVKFVETDDEDDKTIKEINILKDCDSPYIVRYFGCYAKDNILWIVMEYCPGGSVKDVMRLCKRSLNEDEIAAILHCVVTGLVYLHAHKVLHRDVKASNILLSADGVAKLADFGVSAQLSHTIQRRESVVGSPHWMAPEVLVQDHLGYDNKADIWSLGITAIELAEGVPPRAGMHLAQVLLRIPSEPPPTLQDPNKWSVDIRDFIAKCLKKSPMDRPSAQELLSHPFVRRGAESQSLLRPIVEECLPILEDNRYEMEDFAVGLEHSENEVS